MKIDRLFKILYILINKKQVTAKYLADKFEVSIRTIYRDIDTLSMSGIPVYTNKGKGGGISLMENFIMNKSMLSSKDQNNILLGLEILKSTQYDNIEDAMQKLKAVFNKTNDSWIEVDFSHWGSYRDEKLKFEKLKYALTSYLIVEFYYYDSSGKKTKRKIYPLKLIFKEKSWYLVGFCILRNDYRVFKIQRIKNVVVLKEGFCKDKYDINKIDLSYEKINTTKKSTNLIEFEIIIDSKLKNRVYNEFNIEDIKFNKDGDFNIKFIAHENDWLYNYFFSYENHIKIIKPIEVKDIMIKKLEMVLEYYNSY
ncbi:YafY family protein [Peptostreptococcaceae bacterium AGR-M142]